MRVGRGDVDGEVVHGDGRVGRRGAALRRGGNIQISAFFPL